MQVKKKTCKGIGITKDYGCGIETYKRERGLCPSCLYDFYTTSEIGKVIFEKRKLKVKSTREKAFKSDLKEKIKTLSDYETEAKKVFQKYIRLRDEVHNCISCGTTKAKSWHGSHYFSANLYSGLIFDERNVHKSCDYCNVFLHGNLLEYRKGLIERYGNDFVEKLENDSIIKRNYKYTKDELIKIKNKYLKLCKS